LNRRHRLAQYAARASVELFTVLYFKNRHLDETAHIIRVLRQGIVVLVDKCAHARPAPAGARVRPGLPDCRHLTSLFPLRPHLAGTALRAS